MAAAETAPKGQKKPVERRFQGVSIAYAPEIDRSAMWASCEQHTLEYRGQVRALSYFRVSPGS